MSSTTIAPPVIGRTVPVDTDRLLLAGTLAGPFFATSAIIQMLTREGFDVTRHPISQLSTGGAGWIQMATFALAGLGVLTLAVGLRRRLTTGTGRRLLPRMVAVFGAGLVAAGLFPMDPEQGFPVGTPDGPAESMSWHSIAHTAAATVAFTGLAIGCIVATVRSVRENRHRAAVGHGLVAAVLLLPVMPAYASIQLAATGAVAFTWTTVLAVRLRQTPAAD